MLINTSKVTCMHCQKRVNVMELLGHGCPNCYEQNKFRVGRMIEICSPYGLKNAEICTSCKRTSCKRDYFDRIECVDRLYKMDITHVGCMIGKGPNISEIELCEALSDIDMSLQQEVNINLLAKVYGESIIFGVFMYVFCAPNCVYTDTCPKNKPLLNQCYSDALSTSPTNATEELLRERKFSRAILDHASKGELLTHRAFMKGLWRMQRGMDVVISSGRSEKRSSTKGGIVLTLPATTSAINSYAYPSTVKDAKDSYNGPLFMCKL